MNKNAFTLIEIIVVAVIVGILGMMTIPNMLKSVSRSYAQDAMHNLIALYAAQQNFAQNHGGSTYLSCGTTLSDCINKNDPDTGLSLSIVSNGGIEYSCDKDALTCAAVSAESNFTMKVSLKSSDSVNVTSSAVYCDSSGNPNSVHNPCCTTAGGGAPDSNCP